MEDKQTKESFTARLCVRIRCSFINFKNSKTTLHRVLQVNVHSISCHPIANTAALLSKSTLATVLTAKICYILHNYSSLQVAIS